MPFGRRIREQGPHARLRDRNLVHALVGETHHQAALPVMRRDDGDIREKNAWADEREAHENERGEHRDREHAEEDFDARQHMPIGRLRMHVAIADSGVGLDREEEIVEKRARRIGDRLIAERIQEREDAIDDEEGDGRADGRTSASSP